MSFLLSLVGLLTTTFSAGCSSARPPGPAEPAPVTVGGEDEGVGAVPLVVDDFACLDQDGKFHRLTRNSDVPWVVLYVFMDDCKIVRQNASELARLAEEFGPRGVRFLGIDPVPHDDRASVAEEAGELGLALPILLDDTQLVAEMLGLTRTAEALVVSTKSWKVAWRGPLDDRLEYGAQRDRSSREYLREALEAVLAEKPPRSAASAVKGCALTLLQPRDQHEVEYARDVAPILERRCVTCHRDNGIGPWKMNGYERVRGFGRMMRQEVLARRMPPWHADPAHGTFLEDVGLRPEEARTLVHWVENLAPRGAGEDPLAAGPAPLPEWPLGEPDMIVELPLQEIPATGRVPNRDITVALGLETERWVRAVDLRSSNPEVLHHAFAFVPGVQELDTIVDQFDQFPAGMQEQAAKWLAEHPDARPEDLPDYAREALARRAFQGRTYFAKYFPGQLVDAFPQGTGKLLPAGTDLMFELHYTTNGAPTTDRPRLGLYFHDAPPPRELKVASTWTRKVAMQPHQRGLEASAERAFAHPFVVYSLSPHMHYRGRSMRYTAILPDGGRQTLLSVTDYVFDWQANYTLAEPLRFPAGTRVLCEAVYDNSAQNESNPDPNMPVRFGPRTEDEMFVGYIVYSKE